MLRVALAVTFLVGLSLAAPRAHAADNANHAKATNVPEPSPSPSPLTEKQKITASRKDAEEIAAKMPNDQNQYIGDRIVSQNNRSAVTLHPDGTDDRLVCVPAGTYLRGNGTDSTGKLPMFVADCNYCDQFKPLEWCQSKSFCNCNHPDFAKCQAKGADAYLKDPSATTSQPEASPDESKHPSPQKVKCAASEHKGKGTSPAEVSCPEPQEPPPLVITGGTSVRLDNLTTNPPNRYGWTYGGLIVPFKFHLTGKKEVEPSASAAPYMGYRFGFYSKGIELDTIAFAGVGVVKGTNKKTTETKDASGAVTATDTDKSSSELAAFSYGFGLMGVLKGGFQFGALLGFDHTGNGQGYKHNDKPWVGLEIGYSWRGASGG